MAADGRSGVGLAGSDRHLPRRDSVDPDWLAARAGADSDARTNTLDRLIPALLAHLAVPGSGEVALLDVGAGTGANQRWLRPHLPLPQRWVQLDRDPAMTQTATGGRETLLITGDITAVPGLLRGFSSQRRVLCCAALLDVLTSDEVRALCSAAAEAGAAALFSLTVTGTWELDPPDPWDTPLRQAFNAHQRRAGLAGPEAFDMAIAAYRATGSRILTADTDWHLDRSCGLEFVDRFLRERVGAAVEMSVALAEPAADWLSRRRAQLAGSRLRIRVGHRDLLALPDLVTHSGRRR